MIDFTGQHFIITGAAGGMGRAISSLFSELGATLSLWDKTAAVYELGQHLSQQAWQTDLTDPNALRLNADKCHGRAPLTGLILAQGVLSLGAAEELHLDDWNRCITHNATASMLCCQAVIPLLTSGGSITQIGSNAAYIARHNMAAYAASKACIAQYLNCLGLELAPRGIRCNQLAPGSTSTAMQADMPDAAVIIRGQLDQFRAGIPLGRLASPEDIAKACAFLASTAANHITLARLTIDGGASLGC
ncbi:MAG TPA: SDR family oxidoreductase [Cellvibrionaceae bacterium]